MPKVKENKNKKISPRISKIKTNQTVSKIKPKLSSKKTDKAKSIKDRQSITKRNNTQRTLEIEKGLKSIYQDEKGRIPKMNSLDFKKKNLALRLLIMLIVILTIIFAVSFLGFLVFQPTPKFTSNKVNLEIKAPFSAISGENITYEIKCTNSEDITLTNSQLIVYLPHGFIFESSNQPPLENNESETEPKKYTNIKTWQLNDIKINKSKTIEIKGKLIGILNSNQSISATLSYYPSNFSSEFQKTATFNTEIINSLVKSELEYSNQIANMEETVIELNINNTSNELDLNNIEVEFNYPSEFTLLQTQINEPNTDNQPEIINEKDSEAEDINFQKLLLIPNLNKQTQKFIQFTGQFEVEESREFDLNIKIKLKGPAEEYFVQQEETLKISVIKGELLTRLIIQGSNQNKPVNFDQTLNYLINIQNKSKNTLGDVKIRAIIDSPFLEWSSLEDEYNGIKDESQILWTKDQIPDLAILFPEEEVTIELQINVSSYQKSTRYKDDDYQIKSFFESQINRIDNNETEIVIESNTIINEINTNLNLEVNGRYFDDNNQTIGAGPLPPIVGQKTSYKIFWKITNSLHEITDIEVKTKLPDYIIYEGKENISTGNLFLNQQNEIVWQISRVPNSIGESIAEFEISLTPASSDAQKILTLISDVIIKATDAITQGQINKTFQGVTTNLETDPQAQGKGLIQEQ